jgi:hypothetical protein
MHIVSRLLLSLALGAVALVAASASATAGVTTSYHGIFSGPVAYQGCTSQPPVTIAGGRWSVVLHDRTDAVLTVNIFTNGEHHVAFGAPVPAIEPGPGDTFAVALETLAGPLVVRLTGTTLTYRISPYDAFGIACDSVTYFGTLR